MTDRFQAEYPKVWENICNDPFLGLNRQLKKELIDIIITNYNDPAIDKNKRDEAIEKFCNTHSLKGNQIYLSPGECLGRVQNRGALQNRISRLLSIHAREIEEVFDNWLADDDKKQVLQYIINFCGSESICNKIMWGFRNPNNAHDPFCGYDVRNMPCLLGLKYLKPRYIYYVYCLSESIIPRLPTFCDAGFYDAWEPGGWTKPLRKCEIDTLRKHECGMGNDCRLTDNEKGFPEAVHEPIPFDYLQKPFKEISDGE